MSEPHSGEIRALAQAHDGQTEDTLYDLLCGPGIVIDVADAVRQTFRELKAVRKCLKLWRGHIGIGHIGTLAKFAEANGVDSTALFRATQKHSVENFMQAEVVVQRIISICGARLLTVA